MVLIRRWWSLSFSSQWQKSAITWGHRIPLTHTIYLIWEFAMVVKVPPYSINCCSLSVCKLEEEFASQMGEENEGEESRTSIWDEGIVVAKKQRPFFGRRRLSHVLLTFITYSLTHTVNGALKKSRVLIVVGAPLPWLSVRYRSSCRDSRDDLLIYVLSLQKGKSIDSFVCLLLILTSYTPIIQKDYQSLDTDKYLLCDAFNEPPPSIGWLPLLKWAFREVRVPLA